MVQDGADSSKGAKILNKRRKFLAWHDVKHIWWLARNAVKQSCKGNWGDAVEAIYLIRVHLKYDSNLKKEG